MPKITDEEILAAIEAHEANALNFHDSEIAQNRHKALDYYLGRPFGNEVEGRSQAIVTDVADTIEWVMPSLLKVFQSGDEVVSFSPVGQEDIDGAEQETAYVNYVVNQKNPGFLVFYSWFKDALLAKVGYVKSVWEEKTDTTKETYQGLNDDEMTMLLSDPEVEPIEHTDYAEQQPDGSYMMLHDVRMRRTKKNGQVKIYPVPAEELLVAGDLTTIDIKQANFVQHRPVKTISEIREMGYDIPDDIPGDDEAAFDYLHRAHFDTLPADPSMRRVTLHETYIRIDYDGDGLAELRKVISIGREILENEEADTIPFSSITPVILTHQHVGLSYADLIMDLQLIRSTILRQVLDNMYLSNNGRTAISDQVNLDDMLTSLPGGVVRLKSGALPGSGHIMPLVAPDVSRAGLGVMDFMEGLKENRTGITKYNQGLDANSLNKTATGISQIMTAAQQRIELIARIFAETGVKDLFLTVHELILKHATNQDIFRLRNKWVPVDPRQWKKRTDMTIAVGLGTGNKDQMLQHLTTIMQVQERAFPSGIVKPKNVFNAASKLAENAGFRLPEEFFSDPENQEQQQGPSPEQQQAEAQQRAEMQQAQAELEIKRQEIEMKMQLAREEMMLKIEIQREQMAADMQLKREEMMFKASQETHERV